MKTKSQGQDLKNKESDPKNQNQTKLLSTNRQDLTFEVQNPNQNTQYQNSKNSENSEIQNQTQRKSLDTKTTSIFGCSLP